MSPQDQTHPNRSAGFVLVNALVLVAALAGIAVFLLARAEGARARQAETQSAAQAQLYLDAFEALAVTLLAADRRGGDADHLNEAWARADYDVALDRGRVAGEITDMQGRFNVNWLADPGDTVARAGFDALIQRLGMAPGLSDAIAEFLSPQGPGNAAAFAGQSPALAPLGGPVLMLDQLLAIPALDARDFARLEPFLTALPGDQTLNVNTAPPAVLRSLVPGLTPVAANQLAQSRRLEPFVSVDDFALRAGGLGVVALDEEALQRFGIGSAWFTVRMRATLDGRTRHRVAVFERQPLPAGVRVAYRLNAVP